MNTAGFLVLLGLTSSLAACSGAEATNPPADAGPSDAHVAVPDTGTGETCAALNQACSAGVSCCGTYVCSNVSGASTCQESVPPVGDGGCIVPPTVDDPRCPSGYPSTHQGEACAPLGLSCSYPGEGDPTANGCPGTAFLTCEGDGGAGDSGADGGAGTWLLMQ